MDGERLTIPNKEESLKAIFGEEYLNLYSSFLLKLDWNDDFIFDELTVVDGFYRAFMTGYKVAFHDFTEGILPETFEEIHQKARNYIEFFLDDMRNLTPKYPKEYYDKEDEENKKGWFRKKKK